jgi:hypothetical protein
MQNKLTFKKVHNFYISSGYDLYLNGKRQQGYYIFENVGYLGGFLIPDKSLKYDQHKVDTLQEAKQLCVYLFNRDKDAEEQTDIPQNISP